MKRNFVKRILLLLGMTGACISFLLLTNPTSAFFPTATAYCGADSSVDCWGGTRCEAVDNRYCKCTGAGGHWVSYHSCSEAAQRGLQSKEASNAAALCAVNISSRVFKRLIRRKKV